MDTAQILDWLIQYKYLVILPLATVEGPIVSVMSGLLLHLGYLSFWPTYLTLMLGDLIGDVGWYYVGHWAARPFVRRFGHKFGFTPARVEMVEGLFKKHYKKTLLASKLTTGFGLAIVILVTAGSVGVPFLSYILINTIGQLIWSLFLIVIGVFFGQFYVTIDAQFRTIYVVGVILVLGAALYFVQKYLRAHMAKKEL